MPYTFSHFVRALKLMGRQIFPSLKDFLLGVLTIIVVVAAVALIYHFFFYAVAVVAVLAFVMWFWIALDSVTREDEINVDEDVMPPEGPQGTSPAPQLDKFWRCLRTELANLQEHMLEPELIILPKAYAEEMTKTLHEETPLAENQNILGFPVVLTEGPAEEAYLVYKNREGATCRIALL